MRERALDGNHAIVLGLVLDAAAEVFGQAVLASDDFFSLGGDSIAAVELAVRLEEQLPTEVDTALIVDLPDFAALAAALTEALGGLEIPRPAEGL